jgi:broad specificity phosphatase PhoE
MMAGVSGTPEEGDVTVELIYETHSITTDNESGVATGWLPGELSDMGRELARNLGERRRGDGLAAVFTSDLARAVQTARIAFADSGIPIRMDRRLRECHYGNRTGLPVGRVAEEKLYRIDRPFPSGQSYRQVVDKTRDFLRELAGEWDGRTVLVIAHSANRYALDHLLRGRELADLVVERFEWRPGWHYQLPAGWCG